MDFIIAVLYLFVLSILGWIIYRRDCSLSMFIVKIFIFVALIQICFVVVFRYQGLTYESIVKKMIRG